MTQRRYEGTELELFSEAANWREYTKRLLAPHIAGRVLEVGAGIGTTTCLFCDTKPEAWLSLEPDPALHEVLVKAVEERCSSAYTTRNGTIGDLSPDEKYDTIVYVDVLEHIDNDRGELQQAAQHLSESGRLVVLSPAHMWLYSRFDSAIGHVRRYSARSLRNVLPTDFGAQTCIYLDSAGLLASLANRTLLRQREPTRSQLRFWDRVLIPVSRVLDPVFARRIGKSLLLVATKTVSAQATGTIHAGH